MTELLMTAAAAATVLLAWNLHRNAGIARVAELNETRRRMSRLVGPGELIIGNRRRRVSLEVTDSTLYYEGSRTKASIRLDSVLAIAYDTATVAGLDIRNGRVLRLRTANATIEFVLGSETVTNWYLVLPPHPERGRSTVVPAATPNTAPTNDATRLA